MIVLSSMSPALSAQVKIDKAGCFRRKEMNWTSRSEIAERTFDVRSPANSEHSLTQPFSTAHRWFSLLNPTADFGVPEWSRERTGGSPSDDADFDRLFIDFNAIGPVCSNTTTHPTAEWIAQQITEAFPWDQAPQYLIRDRDASYGHTVTRRLVAMGTGIDQRRPARPGKMDISNS